MIGYTFNQLVDIEQIQKLLESHNVLTGMAYSILDAEEHIHIAVGWQEICRRFHRVNPFTLARCRESDIHIKTHLHNFEGNYIEYRCKNGLIDVAMPIIIDGRHVATFFTGQFFYDDDRPDREFFYGQAEAFGFDLEEYFKALEQVSVFSREHVRRNVFFLHNMVQVLAETGLRNLRLARETEERRRAEEQITLMNFALDHIREAAYLVDEQARFRYVNNEACRALGYERNELLTLSVADIDLGFPMECWHEHWREIKVRGSLVVERYHKAADDHVFPVENYITYFEFGGEGYHLALVRDITERKLAEESLNAKQKQLASMAVDLSLAEERERRRIASELHDHIGQMLLLSKIKLDSLAGAFRNANNQKTYNEIHDHITQTISDIRSLTQHLNPPLLSNIGLEAALEWLAKRMESDYSLLVDFSDDGSAKPLCEELRAVVFQSARELLINVAKYAGTGAARLTTGLEGNRLRLVVEDRGVGFVCPPNHEMHISRSSSYGLFNIRQRIEYLGGELVIESAPGYGTCATIHVPLMDDNSLESESCVPADAATPCA